MSAGLRGGGTAGRRVRALMGAALVCLVVACEVSQDQEVQLGRQNAEQINSQLAPKSAIGHFSRKPTFWLP